MKYLVLMAVLCTACTQYETTKETRTEVIRVLDQGRSVDSVVKIAQPSIQGIYIDKDGSSTGVIGIVTDVEGDILVGPKRYTELLEWERILAKLLEKHPELRNEIE